MLKHTDSGNAAQEEECCKTCDARARQGLDYKGPANCERSKKKRHLSLSRFLERETLDEEGRIRVTRRGRCLENLRKEGRDAEKGSRPRVSERKEEKLNVSRTVRWLGLCPKVPRDP